MQGKTRNREKLYDSLAALTLPHAVISWSLIIELSFLSCDPDQVQISLMFEASQRQNNKSPQNRPIKRNEPVFKCKEQKVQIFVSTCSE